MRRESSGFGYFVKEKGITQGEQAMSFCSGPHPAPGVVIGEVMSGPASASPVVSHAADSSLLLRPVEAVTSAVRQMPGAAAVRGAFDGMLDTIGVVSPRTRRVAAYAGVGLLGAVGVVEWPVVAAGAAVVWLTQPLRSGTPRTAVVTSAARSALAKPSPAKAPVKAPADRAAATKPTATRSGASRGSGTSAPAGAAPGRPRTTARKRPAAASARRVA
jgi:hypothetical protein